MSGAVGSRTKMVVNYYDNSKHPSHAAAKTSGKGSHGSNFNSSASTFPAAPI